jgi:hypothetical protein
MRKFVPVLLLLLWPHWSMGQYTVPQHTGATSAASGGHTFALVQHPHNVSCSGSSATCAITLTQNTGSGNLGIISFDATTSTTVSISSISGAGSWTHCTNCSQKDSSNDQVDASYIYSTTGGVGSISVTLTTAPGSSWGASYTEYSFTGSGGVTLDASNGNTNGGTTCTTCTMPSLSLTGSRDVIFYQSNNDNGFGCPGSPWTNPCDEATTAIVAAINVTSTLASLAQSPAGNQATSALAFK